MTQRSVEFEEAIEVYVEVMATVYDDGTVVVEAVNAPKFRPDLSSLVSGLQMQEFESRAATMAAGLWSNDDARADEPRDLPWGA